jgi:hypothetical protein
MQAEKSNLKDIQVDESKIIDSNYSEKDRVKLVQLFEILIEMDKTIKEKSNVTSLD